MTEAAPELYCANHPKTPTTLRCNRCEKPICIKCAILTPTGYRCKECVRGQMKTFDTSQWYDFPLAFFVAGFLAFLGSLLTPVVGFFTIFIAPIAGIIAAEAARFVVRRRRGKLLFQVITAGAVLGSLPVLFIEIGTLVLIYLGGGFSTWALAQIIWPGVYVFIVASTVYYRLGGINLKY
jgi:hypothetical protein